VGRENFGALVEWLIWLFTEHPRLAWFLTVVAVFAFITWLLWPTPDKKFRKAASRGDTQQLYSLLKQGADVNGTMWEGFGYTPLMLAAEAGHADTVRALLNAGASVKTSNDFDDTLLMSAAQGGHTETVKVLLTEGIRDGVSRALMFAVRRGHLDAVKVLLEAGVDVNKRGSDGDIPLIRAVLGGQVENAQALVDAGADVNVNPPFSRTALSWAESEGNSEIVTLLKKAGA